MKTKKGGNRQGQKIQRPTKGEVEVSLSDLQVHVTTVSGSVTGTSVPMTVDPNQTVTGLKLLVQGTAHTKRGPTRRVSRKGVTSEFSRVFLDGHELVDEESTLAACGVKAGSVISFAVGKTAGNKLRKAMRQIGEDFANVGDNEILAAVLRDLQGRMLSEDQKGAELLDELYDIFDTDFVKFAGVHDGCLTPFNADGGNGANMQWLVEEKVEGSFPFDTFFGIPVYTRLYNRQEQSIVGQPHHIALQTDTSIASTGYFGGANGQQMACTAHFAGPVGTEVELVADARRVGRTVVSKDPEDFAVVAMDVPCARTGEISTARPYINGVVSRPATFQTPAILNARITQVLRRKFVAQEQGGAVSSQGGDSNAPWNTPGGSTIGVHRSGGPGGDMSVVRLNLPSRAAMLEAPRRSKRLALSAAPGGGPEKPAAGGPEKKQRTIATA